MFRTAWVALALTVGLGGALTACSADGTEPDATSASTTSESPAAATPTELSFGDSESVTWAPTEALSADLSIRVEGVREGDFADFEGLDGAGITEDNQPFYVDAVIANEGPADLGGLDAPLYLLDSDGTLSPPWRFAERFRPCDSGPLPEPFGAGDEAEMCLVFLASPGAAFESVTFQPSVEDPSLRWTGELTEPAERATRRRTTRQRSGDGSQPRSKRR